MIKKNEKWEMRTYSNENSVCESLSASNDILQYRGNVEG